jgi:RNA-binding protein YhbY
VESSWWFWDLLVQRIRAKKGALPPTRVAKHVVQSMYNKLKPGLDGVTRYAAFFRSQASKLEWEQNVGTKGLKRAFIASFIASRLRKRSEDIFNNNKYEGLRKLRHKLNTTMTIGDFTKNITNELLEWAEQRMLEDRRTRPAQNDVHANNPCNQPENQLDWVFAGRSVREMRNIARTERHEKKRLFNDEPAFKAMRLETRLCHLPDRVHGKSQRKCALCNQTKRRTECWICGVTLCCYGEDSESGSCFRKFHLDQQLN